MGLKIGGTLGKMAEGAKKKLKGIKIKDASDFFEKLGSDFQHIPEDAKKAVKDINDELTRLNLNFNELLDDALGKSAEKLNEAPTPEEYANEMALELAKKYRERDGSSAEQCPKVVKGLLVALGASMKFESGQTENMYADSLIDNREAAANLGCSGAFK
ncbi:hypothetical protein [Paenibacillus sp. FSL K6-1558]|uniref:hypothetical protein n=1 Tax=Paenibacillus sp. FSL K6-1558 TaxID=2921473 RepID=UPI0030FCE6C7